MEMKSITKKIAAYYFQSCRDNQQDALSELAALYVTCCIAGGVTLETAQLAIKLGYTEQVHCINKKGI
jgi:hypothetical protein